MKKLSIFLLLTLIFTSCSNDDDAMRTDIALVGEWELVRTAGQFPGSERTGTGMEWQESYVLKADGSFTKIRLRDNKRTEVDGTYILNDKAFTPNQDAVAHLSMIYEFENPIIATCYSDQLREELYFHTEEILKSTYHQCDGLELEYVKKTMNNKQ